MSRTGKWSAVQEVDSRQLANVPMVPSNDFVDEIDMNPSAPRRPFWMDRNWIRSEDRQSFTRDTDTVDEDWCLKEILVGAIIERKPTKNYTKWSIVVRTVIRWEERRMRTIVVFNKNYETVNKKPADVERAENHGRFKSRCRVRSHRNRRRSRK